LDGIKRKAMEQETNRRDANDLSSHMAMLQQTQQETMHKLTHMQSILDRAIVELKETKASQAHHQNYITEMGTFLEQRFGIGKI
jgi:carotenoid cleavage dioxygenase-like enzyme